MKLGAHESIAGGLVRAFERADGHGCEALQIFTTSSRAWAPARRDASEIAEFAAEARRRRMPLLSHASYLLNLASPGPLWQKSRAAFLAELERCEALGVQAAILHPGAHLGAGREDGVERVAAALRWALDRTRGSRVKVVLELTAGQGTSLGSSFAELRAILDGVDEPARTGVCVDTCHAFAAGYDLASAAGYEAVWRAFDRELGLERLVAFHLNDSKRELGAHVDRHAAIAAGRIGEPAFRRLVNDRRFAGLPAVLELPPSLIVPSLRKLKGWRYTSGRRGGHREAKAARRR